MTLMWIMLAILTVLVGICVLALTDQYHTLELVRRALDLQDNPEPLSIPTGNLDTAPLGLPSSLATASHATVLFLSTKCGTCRKIAAGLRDQRVDQLHVVLVSPSRHEGETWLESAGLSGSMVTIDEGERISSWFGLSTTPAAFVLQQGEVVLGQTVPSSRQLAPLLSSEKLRLQGKESSR